MTRLIPRLVVAGTASGVGKTMLTVGLIGALRRRGLIVQPFKCGPDYIDPGYHTRAAGRTCRNLDSWMLDDIQVQQSFARACRGADIAIIEGVMGLFDGAGYDDERASAAQIAKLLGAPVLLVLGIAGAARSAAATALGFMRYDPALTIGAVVLNFAGSERHAGGCGTAITQGTGLPVLGWLPRDARLRVPERHLGLVTTAESAAVDSVLDVATEMVTAHFDLDALCRVASAAADVAAEDTSDAIPATAARPVLAVARDEAFTFHYPDNLDLLEAAGACIVFFSPVQGDGLPPGTAGVYLGGGFPELYAARLAANTTLWEELRALHARGAPILAECGGFMALTEALIDRDGTRHVMGGLVPGTTRMTDRLVGLGYRTATALRDTLLADAGETLRGHEFHYSVWEKPDAALDHAVWSVRGTRPDAPETVLGFAERGLLASYLHLHLGQRPSLAHRLVARLRSAPA
jgi:cobyrinic acid a,c-diamide synthase